MRPAVDPVAEEPHAAAEAVAKATASPERAAPHTLFLKSPLPR
jgi:hypothetical protein